MVENRTGLTAEELLDILADRRFLSLNNTSSGWQIVWDASDERFPQRKGQIDSRDLDALLKKFHDLLASFDMEG